MNLQAITVGVISAVNPASAANLYFSTGPGPTQADGSQVPGFAPPQFISAQVQPVTSGDLRKIEALNLQPVNEKIYISGQLRGAERLSQLGGDLVVLENGATYLVTVVLEGWSGAGWCSVGVKQQNDNRLPYVQRPRF